VESRSPDADWPYPTNLVFDASTFEVDADGVLEFADFDWLAGSSMAPRR